MLVAIAVFALAAPTAHASFPGANGKILLEGGGDLWTLNPDGTGAVNITNTPSISEAAGTWSPDGTKIAFLASGGLWVMNADGSGRVDVTPDTSGPPFNAAVKPTDIAWSPDGTKLAFTNADGCAPGHSPGQLMLIDPDGSNPTQVVCTWPYLPPDHVKGAAAVGVTWHPNGERLSIVGPQGSGCSEDVWVVNRDGTGMADVTYGETGPDAHSNWAPDGSKLVYDTVGDCDDIGGLFTVDGNGTGRTQITNPDRMDRYPIWAPDRSRILFSRHVSGSVDELWTVDPNGGSAVNLTATAGAPGSLLPSDWLAIPQNSYARPRGATPTRVSLVTAYKPCLSPDRTHGPPLAFPSCSSPAKSSPNLTVGTGDSNGKPALNEGYLTMSVQPGVPGGVDDSDVMLDFSIDDVFTNSLTDYTGEVRVQVSLRITDKLNTPSPTAPGAATTVEIPLGMTVACAAVPDPNEGSLCATNTTVDALIPGAVPEGRRAIWQLGTVQVIDGGPDGDVDTPSFNTLFATQGVFIP